MAEWISVRERLPNEGEYVLIWDGEVNVARFAKGISRSERELMKQGKIPDPPVSSWTPDGLRFVKRSDCYYRSDEGGNNTVPYCWYSNNSPMQWFGQDVSFWMPLPEPPKEGGGEDADK